MNTPPKSIQLVSLNEAAKYLSVCRRTVEREITAGRFPRPIKIGRATRIPLSALQTYIDSLARAPLAS